MIINEDKTSLMCFIFEIKFKIEILKSNDKLTSLIDILTSLFEYVDTR